MSEVGGSRFVCVKERNYAVTLLCQSMWHVVGTQWHKQLVTEWNNIREPGAACQLLPIFDLVSLLGQGKKKSLILACCRPAWPVYSCGFPNSQTMRHRPKLHFRASWSISAAHPSCRESTPAPRVPAAVIARCHRTSTRVQPRGFKWDHINAGELAVFQPCAVGHSVLCFGEVYFLHGLSVGRGAWDRAEPRK